MANILAIDPGTTESAYMCLYDGKITEFAIMPNTTLLHIIPQFTAEHFAIETVASYGMAVGVSVFETCFWIGRFIQRWVEVHGEGTFTKVYRKDVKMHLCNSMRAKDSNIRQALIDKFGGEDMAIGNKKCPKCKGKGWYGAGRPICPKCDGLKWRLPPGPLVGISEDVWAALGVAITYSEISEIQ